MNEIDFIAGIVWLLVVLGLFGAAIQEMHEEKGILQKRKRSIPLKLPCGCESVSSMNNPNHRSVLILWDGSRVCKLHGKRYRLIYQEVKLGE